jgi:hypothetical protein
VANKTTTTTTVHSRKDSAGNWQEYDKTVTKVVERDDDGYPYGPIPAAPPYPFISPSGKRRFADDYMTWYGQFGTIPAVKTENPQDKEKPQDG